MENNDMAISLRIGLEASLAITIPNLRPRGSLHRGWFRIRYSPFTPVDQPLLVGRATSFASLAAPFASLAAPKLTPSCILSRCLISPGKAAHVGITLRPSKPSIQV